MNRFYRFLRVLQYKTQKFSDFPFSVRMRMLCIKILVMGQDFEIEVCICSTQ